MKNRFETKGQAPIPAAKFRARIVRHALVALAFLSISIAIGMAGYMVFERLSLVDAFLNTAMLIGGMGPVNPPQTNSGKIFAGCFALYAGLVFIVTAAMILAPVLHRILHQFHWDEND